MLILPPSPSLGDVGAPLPVKIFCHPTTGNSHTQLPQEPLDRAIDEVIILVLAIVGQKIAFQTVRWCRKHESPTPTDVGSHGLVGRSMVTLTGNFIRNGV